MTHLHHSRLNLNETVSSPRIGELLSVMNVCGFREAVPFMWSSQREILSQRVVSCTHYYDLTTPTSFLPSLNPPNEPFTPALPYYFCKRRQEKSRQRLQGPTIWRTSSGRGCMFKKLFVLPSSDMSHHQKETNSYNQIYRMKIRVMSRMRGSRT